MPSGIVANDILLFITESSSADNITLTTANGFALAVQQDDGVSGHAATFWKLAVGGDAAPTTNNPGSSDHVIGLVCLIRGCKTTGNPWNVSSSGFEGAPSDTSLSISGLTTTAPDCLVVQIQVADIHQLGSGNIGSWSNGDLANLTERIDAGINTGSGGYIAVVSGEKATAGAYGATTATTAVNDYKCWVQLAFEGAVADPTFLPAQPYLRW